MYSGEWVNGKFHGKGALSKVTGETFDGTFVRGKFLDETERSPNRNKKSKRK